MASQIIVFPVGSESVKPTLESEERLQHENVDQPFQLANVNSNDPTIVINNVTALAKTAKAYGIPAILTTVNEERGGLIFKQVQAVFPDQKRLTALSSTVGRTAGSSRQ